MSNVRESEREREREREIGGNVWRCLARYFSVYHVLRSLTTGIERASLNTSRRIIHCNEKWKLILFFLIIDLTLSH